MGFDTLVTKPSTSPPRVVFLFLFPLPERTFVSVLRFSFRLFARTYMYTHNTSSLLPLCYCCPHTTNRLTAIILHTSRQPNLYVASHFFLVPIFSPFFLFFHSSLLPPPRILSAQDHPTTLYQSKSLLNPTPPQLSAATFLRVSPLFFPSLHKRSLTLSLPLPHFENTSVIVTRPLVPLSPYKGHAHLIAVKDRRRRAHISPRNLLQTPRPSVPRSSPARI